MNICFVLLSFSDGGIGRVTSILANKLNTIDNVYCYAWGLSDRGEQERFMTTFPVDYAYHDMVSMKEAILKRNFIRKTKEYVEKNRINVIVGCGAMFYPISVLIAKICHIKVICWDHTSPNASTGYAFFKQSREFGARCSDCNLLLTVQAKQIFDKRYPRKNNVQIYNPIASELIIKKSPYDSCSKKIISVGRLCYAKNYDRLVKIASNFLLEYPDWEWDIYGDGYEQCDLNRAIKQSGLEKQVHLCGNVSDIYERYSQYAFIVMTSRFEGFPMVLLEAAANGLPMIAFDVLTGPREIIIDNRNGFLCNENSDEEMISKIKVLINDNELRKKMSEESKFTVKKFELDKICNQWLELLQNIE